MASGPAGDFDVPKEKPRVGDSIFLFGMNQARYDSLPANLKKVIDDNTDADGKALLAAAKALLK